MISAKIRSGCHVPPVLKLAEGASECEYMHNMTYLCYLLRNKASKVHISGLHSRRGSIVMLPSKIIATPHVFTPLTT